jgi:hypothetical protein
MAGEVGAGRVPGMVLGLSRGGDVHVDALGTTAAGTVWVNDPDEDQVAVLCTQVLASPSTWAVEAAF